MRGDGRGEMLNINCNIFNMIIRSKESDTIGNRSDCKDYKFNLRQKLDMSYDFNSQITEVLDVTHDGHAVQVNGARIVITPSCADDSAPIGLLL